MKLFDYMKLVPDGEEITVFDKEYDVETYFYGGCDTGWQDLMLSLADLLKVTKITSSGITVNLSDVIEKHIDKLEKEDLFEDYDIDTIMSEMNNIISGAVSESWMKRFIECLK